MTRKTDPRATLPRRALLAAVPALISGHVFAQETPQQHAVDRARGGRLSLPVLVNGQGPFAFAIDTAANASVIADDLAHALQLQPAGVVGMHTLVGREMVDTVRARRLTSGSLDQRSVRLALGTRSGLDGVDGLIGTDVLAGYRLSLSFRSRARAILRRSRRAEGGFWDAERPQARFGASGDQAFGLLSIAGQSGGIPLRGIIDTGAQVSLANEALASRASTRPIVLDDGSRNARVTSPTGRSVVARPLMLRRLHFAGVSLTEIPVLAGDFHSFGFWGLGDTPAILLGVDILGLFETVVIDMKRGELVLET